jgi:3-methyladenine DNA glycosylase Tag
MLAPVEGPPPQHTARSLDDYLEHMTKPVFQAGISWRVVDAKWPGIRAAFKGFKTERVARMSDRDVDALVKDERVIRSRPKIAAVVHNAGVLVALEREQGFKKYLRSFDDYAALEKDLRKRFKFLGPSGIYHFLWTVKHPVPEWHAWARERGLLPDGRSASGGRTPRRRTRAERR